MTHIPGDVVPFGKEYFYDRVTKDILSYANGKTPEHRIHRSDYMQLADGRHTFSDDMLAVNLLRDELKNRTIPDLNGVTCEWVRLQVALPSSS